MTQHVTDNLDTIITALKTDTDSQGTAAVPADNSGQLAAAARNRHELTRSKAILALRELDRARHADHLRTRRSARARLPVLALLPTRPAGPDRTTARGHRTSPDTLGAGRPAHLGRLAAARLQAAQERNRQLNEDNQRLRRQLAHALGDQRAADRLGNTPETSPKRHSSATTGPC